jgi:hypothetical protein
VPSLPAALQAYGTPEYSDPFGLPQIQNQSIHVDAVTATTSLDKLKRFDSRDDVWVILTHDSSFKTAKPGPNISDDTITLFPATINNWAKKGWKTKTRFAFLEETNPANIWVNVTA